jgi:hypothetical protein
MPKKAQNRPKPKPRPLRPKRPTIAGAGKAAPKKRKRTQRGAGVGADALAFVERNKGKILTGIALGALGALTKKGVDRRNAQTYKTLDQLAGDFANYGKYS